MLKVCHVCVGGVWPNALGAQTPSKFQDSGRVSAELGGGCHGDKGVLVLRNWLTLTEIVRRSERECEEKTVNENRRKAVKEGGTLQSALTESSGTDDLHRGSFLLLRLTNILNLFMCIYSSLE